jgi:hypothetical protein
VIGSVLSVRDLAQPGSNTLYVLLANRATDFTVCGGAVALGELVR